MTVIWAYDVRSMASDVRFISDVTFIYQNVWVFIHSCAELFAYTSEPRLSLISIQDACTVLNQTYMICSTPPIQLPPSSAKRQKRNANESVTFSSYSTQVDVNWFHSYKHGSQQSKRRRFDGNVFSDQRKSRRRRETNETDGGPDVGSRVNREDSNITFFLGFVLDGVSVYRNLSDVLPEYSTVDVYFNPAFFYFEERDNIRAFRPFGSFDDRVLNIEVCFFCC